MCVRNTCSSLIVVGFLLALANAKLPTNYPPPKITLVGSNLERGMYGGNNLNGLGQVNLTFSNSSVYVVPLTINDLTIKCTASYPVFWNLMESHVNSDILTNALVSTSRSSPDMFDPSTFNYTSTLFLVSYGHPQKLTGNYTCESTSYHKIQSSVFIFWEGTNLLVRSLETVTVTAKGNPIILPCGVSTPFQGNPSLMRESSNGGGKPIQLMLNDSISYSKTKGFILDNLPNPIGQYKCLISKDDYVIVKVKPVNDKKKKFTNSTGTFTYKEDTNEFVCCSGSNRPPNIVLFRCDHAITCQLRDHTILPIHFIISRNKRKGNCAYRKVQFMHSTVARCVGDGIDEYKEYIAPLKETWDGSVGFSPYFKWEEIDPQEMFYVAVNSGQPAVPYYMRRGPKAQPAPKIIVPPIYAKQSISADCSTSSYYFSTGVQWATKWKNGSLIPYKGDVSNKVPPNEMVVMRYYGPQKIVYKGIANAEMEALVCFAPVWNSSLWALKTHYLYVNETVAPTLLASDEMTTQSWYLNDTKQSIECEGSGVPAPKIIWLKGTHVLSNNSHNMHIFESWIPYSGPGNGTNTNSTLKSVLTVSRVSHFTSGEFTCQVSNFGGSVSKKFTISVMERKHWGSTIMIIISFIIISALLGVAIYFVARMRKFSDPVISTNPQRLNDTDGHESPVGIDTDICNTSYDNGRMTNQLVNV